MTFTLRQAMLLVLVLVFAVAAIPATADDSRFDRLTDDDRTQFSARFEKEFWPLLKRNGRDGCVGCHQPKHRSTLRLSGEPAADFRMMLGRGFLLPDDPGSVLHLVTTKDPRKRMPPGKRPGWSNKEIDRLRAFLLEIDKKQQE